ncbi:hypothetical protein KAI92_01975 [Candidatus Parcubacteria bacterium]|nr:hypothetical protein [Candidatus Parcubacteria bacterium]
MKIEFIKDITEPGRDGFKLLFLVDDGKLEVYISRTFLGMFNIDVENTTKLFEQFRLDNMINSIDSMYSKDNSFINEIVLDSDGLKIMGKVCYSTDSLRKFIAVREE